MPEPRVTAVIKALEILDVFHEGRDSFSLKELADKTGLYKSRVIRLASTLQDHGYLRRGDDGRYRLGPTLWRLGSLYRRGFNLGDYVRPALKRLVEDVNESASFYVRDGDKRVCLHRLSSRQAIRHHVDEGAEFPLESGIAGSVLRAFSGAEGPLFDQIRRDGYRNARGERDTETASIAAPVFQFGNELAGVLSMAGLRSRFDERSRARALKLLLKEASALSQKLGGANTSALDTALSGKD